MDNIHHYLYLNINITDIWRTFENIIRKEILVQILKEKH